MNPKVPISIVPIRHEAANLARCLACVQWADEIFVVDSQSTDGSQEIAGRADNYSFPPVEIFIEKHNRYSNWEARVATERHLAASSGKIRSDVVDRRRRLKLLSHRLPFRPLLRFLYVYIWQKRFLDGWEGYYFARLHATYEFLSVAKTYELLKNSSRPQGENRPRSCYNLSLPHAHVHSFPAQ